MGDNARGLNESHQRRLLVTFQYVDKLLSETEAVLSASSSKSPFPKYSADFTPAQERVIRDYVARIRAQMLRIVAGLGLQVPGPQFGAIHSIRVHLSFIRVALQEASPKNLSGYGPVPSDLTPELDGFSTELQNLAEELNNFLGQDPGLDLAERLQHLTLAGDHISLLKKLERVISTHGLVEFRSALANIVDRLAAPRFEIAVFGQVSSGKSSLLNSITGIDALPVGVTPVTSVPTRLVYGPPGAVVSFAGGQAKTYEVAGIAEFVTEERNPANTKGVTRIVVSVPSERLRDGVVFVDTPGLGSLATAGAAETRAYLPQCDLGLVLVNASSTLTTEDVQLVQTLYMGGIPVIVLLSKSDLATPVDRERAVRYVGDQLKKQLGIAAAVYPVSIVPEYRDLTETWFKTEIEPLYSKYQELAAQSIKRKIAILRDGVEAALTAKLDGAGAAPSTTEELEAAEKALRTAAGQISEIERKCYELTDELREAGAEAGLERAARALAESWAGGQDGQSAEIVRTAFKAVAAEQASEVVDELKGLADRLVAAIRTAGGALKTKPETSMDDFTAALRELPQMDLSKVEITVKRPLAAALGRHAAVGSARRRIAARWSDVEAAFIGYARLLQAWMRASLKRISDLFDSGAGPLRAQLERLLAGGAVSADSRQRILADLEDIRSGVETMSEGVGDETVTVQ